jgi:hypothetical protein
VELGTKEREAHDLEVSGSTEWSEIGTTAGSAVFDLGQLDRTRRRDEEVA